MYDEQQNLIPAIASVGIIALMCKFIQVTDKFQWVEFKVKIFIYHIAIKVWYPAFYQFSAGTTKIKIILLYLWENFGKCFE